MRESAAFSEADAKEASSRLESADPREILTWCTQRSESVGMTCSFGGTGIVLAHMVSVLGLDIPIYFLDTGFLFAETLRSRQDFAERYGLRIIDVRPELSALDQTLRHGDDLYLRNPDLCCHLRKVETMRRVLESMDIWISGLRRDQSSTRSRTEVVEDHHLDDGRIVLKVSPLARWTRDDAWRYIGEHGLPYNPLLDQGYKSIGCWPCTASVSEDADERTGRWQGSVKTECGLHTFTRRLGSQDVRVGEGQS